MDRFEELEKRVAVLEDIAKEAQAHLNRPKRKRLQDLEGLEEGMFNYSGKYSSIDGGLGASFGGNVKIRGYFEIDSFEIANVLNAFASEERIEIVKALMQKSKYTAKELMEKLKFQTTGKLYHHLSFLEKIGILKKEGEYFRIVPRYVSCIVMVFTAAGHVLERNNQEE